MSRPMIKPRRFRPTIEGLEDRFAPAVFNVNSLADILTPAAGTVTLRSAIEAANATPGNNIINLTVPGVYKITLAGCSMKTTMPPATSISWRRPAAAT